MSAEGNVSMLMGDPKKAIRAMTVPLLVALLVIQVNALADRAWCSGLGTDALAATAICAPLYEVITGLGTGLGVGGAAVVSRFIGAGSRREASQGTMQTIIFSLVFGIVLTPILVLFCSDILVAVGSGDVTDVSYDYMIWIMLGTPVFILNGAVAGLIRGEGAARMSTVMMVVLAVANIVLDPVLIYGLDMGIAGASVATVLATVISTLIGLYYYRESSYIKLGRDDVRFDTAKMRTVLRAGVPQMAEYTVMYAMNLVLNYLVIWCAAELPRHLVRGIRGAGNLLGAQHGRQHSPAARLRRRIGSRPGGIGSLRTRGHGEDEGGLPLLDKVLRLDGAASDRTAVRHP